MSDRALDLTSADVTSGVWRYFVPGGAIVSDCMRFMADGRITGYDHLNERRWALDGGALCFLNDTGAITCRFDQDITRNGVLSLQGRSLLGNQQTLCVQRRDWATRQALKDTTAKVFAAEIDALGWQIGKHTYGRPIVFERDARLVIGAFTSIAFGVQIALGNHRTDYVSTYPFATLSSYWPSAPTDTPDHETRGDVTIGNDVWLGAACFIASGVTIGDGAVIGAHTTVLKDVPPYTVVVGNPARIVRSRFAPHIVDRLLRIAWWTWPDDRIDRYLPLILSPDIQPFIRAVRREQKQDDAS